MNKLEDNYKNKLKDNSKYVLSTVPINSENNQENDIVITIYLDDKC